MTTEEIKKIVDDEQAEQLTAQLCRHWEVATQRLECLAQELNDNMDTCVEAEIYAALMRMQKTVMALMELNKIPTAFLFSEYLERITKTVSNTSIRQSVMTLVERLLGEKQEKQQQSSFFDMIIQSLAQHFAMSPEKQAAIQQKVSPMQHIFAVCAQHLNPNDLMMVAEIIQKLNTEGDTMNQEETTNQLKEMRQAMDELNVKMSESLQMMLIWLLLLMLLPSLVVSFMQQSRTNSKAMAQLFNKVLVRVRQSNEWWDYWNDRRETLKVVSDDNSWKDIMMAERTKVRTELGQVPGGLFAKYTTDFETFEEEFLDVHLSDDALRHFIFHLAALAEIAREINPTTKFGDEQLVNNELQLVGEAVLSAASKLHNLLDDAWLPHYDAMWKALIENKTIFARLKVTRKSPHNKQFTARFFCHLVGEMKKSAVFGASSDGDLAEMLTAKRYKGTYRKNIQEGMDKENIKIQKAFYFIYQKYNDLAHPKK
ncbi:MAG: hypothetical protein J6Q22_12170 [Prevotella sp.]|nr:hypothetical protein [Prevotella sp.]